jgi:hypothetical protein
MKDDYLWDKSGQPDPEIQKLEEILGTLRYQPKPLGLAVSHRRRIYFPLLAISASLLLALLAGGIWLRVRNQSAPPAPHEAQAVPAPPKMDGEKSIPATGSEPIRDKSKNTFAVNNRPHHKSVSSALSKREREEALLAKEQLMMALRLTTEKLSLVHRKSPNTNLIKNQHRVG